MRQKQREKLELGATAHNSRVCVDATGAPTERKKILCPGCGLPRDPELAQRRACGACNTMSAAPAGADARQSHKATLEKIAALFAAVE